MNDSTRFADRCTRNVAVHGGTFDAPEKHSLRAFSDTKREVQREGGGGLGLGADELRVLESALA
jgi:hypothetical protein